jgi:hypothetical protein
MFLTEGRSILVSHGLVNGMRADVRAVPDTPDVAGST